MTYHLSHIKPKWYESITYLFSYAFISLSLQSSAQSLGKALVTQGNKHLSKGDTISVFGRHPVYQEYLVNYGGKYRTLPINRIHMITLPSEFWAFQWLNHVGYDYHNYPSGYTYKNAYNERLLQYRLNRFSEAETSFERYLKYLEDSNADSQKLKW